MDRRKLEHSHEQVVSFDHAEAEAARLAAEQKRSEAQLALHASLQNFKFRKS